MDLPNAFLGMGAPPGGNQPGNPWVNFVPILLIFVIFYFLVMAPQRKRQKKHNEMLGNLKSGDRVVTSGGLYGTVVGVTDTIVQLRIADQVKVDVARHAIAELRQE
jgi:preprotein translocase subunit YajC